MMSFCFDIELTLVSIQGYFKHLWFYIIFKIYLCHYTLVFMICQDD